jgi:hypothetical protein
MHCHLLARTTAALTTATVPSLSLWRQQLRHHVHDPAAATVPLPSHGGQQGTGDLYRDGHTAVA